jgi:hypothetical protein
MFTRGCDDHSGFQQIAWLEQLPAVGTARPLRGAPAGPPAGFDFWEYRQ